MTSVPDIEPLTSWKQALVWQSLIEPPAMVAALGL